MAKGMMIVDGQRVNFDGEKNVLSVIRKAGIEMPTFCYYSDLSVYGACRMCVVEDEKTGKIDASCSMEPRDGMRISTNSARLLKHRRVILELLLASHNCNCTTCEKSGHCRLQELAQQFGVRKIRFPDTREHYEIDSSSPAVLRDPNKCILCGDCVRVCEEMQGMGILNFAYRGSNLQVMPAFDRKLAETKCVSCGQCAAVCTTGAITVKNQIGEAWRAIHDPSKRVRSHPPCAWLWARHSASPRAKTCSTSSSRRSSSWAWTRCMTRRSARTLRRSPNPKNSSGA